MTNIHPKIKSPKDTIMLTPADKEAMIARCPKAIKSIFRNMETTCAGLTVCGAFPDASPELAAFDVEPAVSNNNLKVGDTWFTASCMVVDFDGLSRLTIFAFATQVTKMGEECFDEAVGTVYSAYTGEFKQVAKVWLKLQAAAQRHCKKTGLSYSDLL